MNNRFLVEMLKQISDKLKMKDVEALVTKMKKIVQDKKKATPSKGLANQKAQDMTKKHAKYDIQGEYNMMYGENYDYDDEEEN